MKNITSTTSVIDFEYNPFGQRILKKVKDLTTGAITNSYYAYDANGQVMGVYTLDFETTGATLNELNLYGASRIGIIDKDVDLCIGGTAQAVPVYPSPSPVKHILGYKKYEITNYLGNVNAVINDRKIYTGGTYTAVMLMNSDYYPFGMQMPGRNTNLSTYRYGYNGMEMDNEAKGNGNSYTTEFRQYDPRLGRWLSLDPLMAKYPGMSPYVAFNNNPVLFVDPLGLEGDPPTKDWKKGDECVDENRNVLVYEGDGVWNDKVTEIEEITIGKYTTKQTNALKQIDVFESSNTKYIHFPEITKRQLSSDLRSLVINPNNTEQLPNTCGLSAAQYYILQDNPERFVEFVINVYTQQDEHILSEDGVTKLSLDRNEINDLPAEGNSASWIFQGTVRNTYNEFLDYDPRESSNDQLGGITTPNEVIALMKTFGFTLTGNSISNDKVVNSRTILLIDWRGQLGTTMQWHYINLIGSNNAHGYPTAHYFDTNGFDKMTIQTGMGFSVLPKAQGAYNFRYGN